MSTRMDELRDVQEATRTGRPVGEYRRAKKIHRNMRVMATPSGTRLSGRHINQSILVSDSQMTGNGVNAAASLGLLRTAVHNVNPTGGKEALGFLNPKQAASSGAEILGRMSALMGPIGLGVGPAELSLTVSQALRSWYARRALAMASSAPSRRHAGIAAVEWLVSYLGVSRDQALRIGRVPQATYYSWLAKPDTVVRPKSVRQALRVVASLKLLISALGAEEARVVLSSGSPSLLDQLAASPSDADVALNLVAENSQPRLVVPSRRFANPDAILGQLRKLEVAANELSDPDPLGPATPLAEGEAHILHDDAGDEPQLQK